MRAPEAALLLGVAALSMAGCSRLTFVKPDGKRKGFDQVAPNYDVRESAEGKRRTQALNQLALAGEHLRRGEDDQAERAVRDLLKLEPASADAYTLLAVVEERRGQFERAGEHYRRAVDLAPAAGANLNNYGAWLCANGHAAESLPWFDRALADSTYRTPALALANAGDCAMRTGQYERAERDLRDALAREPENARALAAMAENEFRKQRYFEARAFSQRRLAAAPADPVVLQLAIRIEQMLGDKAAASRYMQQLREEFPEASAAVPREKSS